MKNGGGPANNRQEEGKSGPDGQLGDGERRREKVVSDVESRLGRRLERDRLPSSGRRKENKAKSSNSQRNIEQTIQKRNQKGDGSASSGFRY